MCAGSTGTSPGDVLRALYYAISLYGFIVSFFIYPKISDAQVILSEIMFDPDTLENHNEFVEIFNSGNSVANLRGWQIGDDNELDYIQDAGSGLMLAPGQYGVILDASYFANSTSYDNLLPPEALIMTIDDGSFGSYGWSNTLTETVFLTDSAGNSIQVYQYSLGNKPGFSDEKVIMIPDNSEMNWKNSLKFRGTPGFENSVRKKETDIGVDSLWIIPSYPVSGIEFDLKIQVRNLGILPVESFKITVFEDVNQNFFPETDEIILTDSIFTLLGMEDSTVYSCPVAGFSEGEYLLAVKIDTKGDLVPDNNFRVLTVVVEPAEVTVIMNEIMFKPLTGHPEWIELYNKGFRSIDLQNWKLADARDTVLITPDNFLFEPGNYVLLCGDSSIYFHAGLQLSQAIIFRPFPNLNNDGDDLKLFSRSGRLMERIFYSDSWLRRDPGPGVSLERIHPDISGAVSGNWTASVDLNGSTPGLRNSVFIDQPVSKSVFSIYPNPFSPDGDGFEDFSIISYQLPFETGYITLDIFDAAGRKIRRLADFQPTGQKGNLVWDGLDDRGRMARIGLYIVLCRIFEPDRNIFQETKKTIVLIKRS